MKVLSVVGDACRCQGIAELPAHETNVRSMSHAYEEQLA